MRSRRLFVLLALVAHLAACAPNSPQPPVTGLSVLTLNLHTYQEGRATDTPESELTDTLAQQRIDAYAPIFDRIAAGIVELDPDVICFQEVGEWRGSTRSESESVRFGATDSNMVNQVLSRLPDRQYHYFMDWSHYGWDVWLEGSAILSKYPLRRTEARFISRPGNSRLDFWKSRKVPMASIDVPGIGGVTIFSVHAGWWDDLEEPFQEQYRRLLSWAAEVKEPASATILCGDFNIPAGSSMYLSMIDGTGYADQYARANPDGMLDATIGGGADGWEDSDSGKRIDYILMNDDSSLEVARARRVFTEAYLGRVSDHVGVFAEFRIKARK